MPSNDRPQFEFADLLDVYWGYVSKAESVPAHRQLEVVEFAIRLAASHHADEAVTQAAFEVVSALLARADVCDEVRDLVLCASDPGVRALWLGIEQSSAEQVVEVAAREPDMVAVWLAELPQPDQNIDVVLAVLDCELPGVVLDAAFSFGVRCSVFNTQRVLHAVLLNVARFSPQVAVDTWKRLYSNLTRRWVDVLDEVMAVCVDPRVAALFAAHAAPHYSVAQPAVGRVVELLCAAARGDSTAVAPGLVDPPPVAELVVASPASAALMVLPRMLMVTNDPAALAAVLHTEFGDRFADPALVAGVAEVFATARSTDPAVVATVLARDFGASTRPGAGMVTPMSVWVAAASNPHVNPDDVVALVDQLDETPLQVLARQASLPPAAAAVAAIRLESVGVCVHCADPLAAVRLLCAAEEAVSALGVELVEFAAGYDRDAATRLLWQLPVSKWTLIAGAVAAELVVAETLGLFGGRRGDLALELVAGFPGSAEELRTTLAAASS